MLNTSNEEQCTIVTEQQEIKLADFELPLKVHRTPQKARSITNHQMVNIICNSVSAHSQNLKISQLGGKKKKALRSTVKVNDYIHYMQFNCFCATSKNFSLKCSPVHAHF